MNYREFINTLQKEVQKHLGDKVQVKLQKIVKNNDTHKDSLLLFEEGSNISPAVYMDEYYPLYKEQGYTIKELVSHVCEMYEESKKNVSLDIDGIQDFAMAKNHIACKLVNEDMNRDILEKVPHVPYLDLMIVFYYMVDSEEIGNGTILIDNTHLKMWGITQGELYAIARENTRRLLHTCMISMEDVLMELMTGVEAKVLDEEELLEEPDMYILTNDRRNFGAVCILYDGILERIGDQLKSDFYIIPSSVHECIIVPESESKERTTLEDMVREVNSTQVLPEEVLSDSIYHYDCKKHHLTM